MSALSEATEAHNKACARLREAEERELLAMEKKGRAASIYADADELEVVSALLDKATAERVKAAMDLANARTLLGDIWAKAADKDHHYTIQQEKECDDCHQPLFEERWTIVGHVVPSQDGHEWVVTLLEVLDQGSPQKLSVLSPKERERAEDALAAMAHYAETAHGSEAPHGAKEATNETP